jgi:hypothetical protein
VTTADWLELIRYNTAVFSSLSANAYDYLVVSEEFFSPSITFNTSNLGYLVGTEVPGAMHEASLNGSLTNMTSSQCMQAYGINFVSKSRNVLLVTTDKSTSKNSLLSFSQYSLSDAIPYSWICGDSYSSTPFFQNPPSAVCTTAIATAAVSDWTVDTYRISYCMVEEVVEECQLSFSLLIMLVVISVNAAKTCISKYTPLTFPLTSTNPAVRLDSSEDLISWGLPILVAIVFCVQFLTKMLQ